MRGHEGYWKSGPFLTVHEKWSFLFVKGGGCFDFYEVGVGFLKKFRGHFKVHKDSCCFNEINVGVYLYCDWRGR